jgi:hypothetical protein
MEEHFPLWDFFHCLLLAKDVSIFNSLTGLDKIRIIGQMEVSQWYLLGCRRVGDVSNHRATLIINPHHQPSSSTLITNPHHQPSPLAINTRHQSRRCGCTQRALPS